MLTLKMMNPHCSFYDQVIVGNMLINFLVRLYNVILIIIKDALVSIFIVFMNLLKVVCLNKVFINIFSQVTLLEGKPLKYVKEMHNTR